MICPKISGRLACFAAKKTSVKRSERVRSRPLCWAFASRRIQFSTITTAPSTITEKSNAPELIRLVLIFCSAIPVRVNSIDKGIIQAVINAARKLPGDKQDHNHQDCTFDQVFRHRVLMALSTKSLRLYTVSTTTPSGNERWIPHFAVECLSDGFTVLTHHHHRDTQYGFFTVIGAPPVLRSCPIETVATSATRIGVNHSWCWPWHSHRLVRFSTSPEYVPSAVVHFLQ